MELYLSVTDYAKLSNLTRPHVHKLVKDKQLKTLKGCTPTKIAISSEEYERLTQKETIQQNSNNDAIVAQLLESLKEKDKVLIEKEKILYETHQQLIRLTNTLMNRIDKETFSTPSEGNHLTLNKTSS